MQKPLKTFQLAEAWTGTWKLIFYLLKVVLYHVETPVTERQEKRISLNKLQIHQERLIRTVATSTVGMTWLHHCYEA